MPRQPLPLIAYVASESEPGKRHAVKAKDGQLTCGCGRWVFNKEWQADHSRPRVCHHTEEVQRQLRAAHLTVAQAARLATTLQATVPDAALMDRHVDPITQAIQEFRRRWSPFPQLAFTEIETLVRQFAASTPAPSITARPAWLGGGRAIILRD